ncbi:MAG: acyloxyacyl hydrolase [Gemmatimonadaceae bacterium]|nr:acyloxyacyl hydrolase [Gemmatimonadaceae bacterium]
MRIPFVSARRVRGLVVVAISLGSAASVRAQRPADRSSTLSIDVTTSVGAASVQPKEALNGSLTGISVQLTHPLGSWAGLQWHYVLEATPLIVARMGASSARLAQIGPGLRPEYAVRQGMGFGVAPLGIQLARALGQPTVSHTRAMLEMTGGGAHYTQIMPYGGDATRTNYTFEARLMLEHRLHTRGAFAVGVGLHHISNGGFGKANPGINARMLVARWARHSTTP